MRDDLPRLTQSLPSKLSLVRGPRQRVQNAIISAIAPHPATQSIVIRSIATFFLVVLTHSFCNVVETARHIDALCFAVLTT
jgi:hypothetical protein